MSDVRPVERWDTDFDVLSPEYVNDPFRDMGRPAPDVPGGAHGPARERLAAHPYKDVVALAHDIEHFSSLDIIVVPFPARGPTSRSFPTASPPISADPPLHTWTRRLILPWFSHRRVESTRPSPGISATLIDGLLADGRADAAADYAQQIPVRVIAHILGVPESRCRTSSPAGSGTSSSSPTTRTVAARAPWPYRVLRLRARASSGPSR